ncbi:TetR/AcrR family transcriptional regulator [Schleiferilactobacillus perolens]|uniref:TetR/AcrR family transcriptional regulator n=1 Tax=Schleiferilactobacillus perolens TaxID=100468 RepID=UPI002353A82A|nr:TetR/AcrR family transcriptional regulator [Schleiferilactobacillus perolens]MCI2170729.1 TetR family transcriptional regulator [Schleiferilactobacillus perolens]
MPTQTFFNLPEMKRQRLIEAGFSVFSRASLEDASVSEIVRLAKISRGSFYQYFADKRDLYFYLLTQMREQWVANSTGTLRRHQGDLFATVRELAQAGFRDVSRGKHRAFYRTLFLNFSYRGTAQVNKEWARAYKAEGHPRTQWAEMVDVSRLNVSNDTQLRTLLYMLFGVFAQNVANYFNETASKNDELVAEQYRQNMLLMFDWLQFGVEKETQEES